VVFKRFIQFIAVAVLLVGASGVALTWYAQALLSKPLALSEPLLFEVKRGMHARTVLRQLQVYSDSVEVTPAYLASRLLDDTERLHAGVYQLQPQDTLQTLWRKLRQGEQHLFRVALVEGRTVHEWLQTLQASEHVVNAVAAQNKHDASERLAELLNIDAPSAEGWFFPDTYTYVAGTKAIDILREAYQRMQHELEQVWHNRAENLPYNNRYELLIMASIIEKETGLSGERARVSSVFVNRMNTGMRLQSDPTTIYGIEPFDGNLTRAHLREQTPFNTYRISGLPPTPIAMPSKASLIAAAHPEETDYFYFVADGSGGHVFSKTLVEHNRAVNRYQRNQR